MDQNPTLVRFRLHGIGPILTWGRTKAEVRLARHQLRKDLVRSEYPDRNHPSGCHTISTTCHCSRRPLVVSCRPHSSLRRLARCRQVSVRCLQLTANLTLLLVMLTFRCLHFMTDEAECGVILVRASFPTVTRPITRATSMLRLGVHVVE